MRIKTNLPKAIIYREASSDITKPAVTFKPTALASSDDFIKVIYEGGHFVAIGENGSVAYSAEGQTWTARKLGDYTFFDIDYIGGTYFIAGSVNTKGLILSSTDLINWKTEVEMAPPKASDPQGSPYALQFRGVWHNGTKYIIMAIAQSTLIFEQYTYTGSNLKELKSVSTEQTFNTRNVSTRLFKGNNRIGLLKNVNNSSSINGTYVWHTSDGSNCENVKLPSHAPVPDNPVFFYEGYFMQGVHYMPPVTSSYYTQYAHIYKSISLKEWEATGPGTQHDSSKVDLPYFVGAVRIGGYSLYIGEHIGMLLADGDNMLEKTQADCFNISQSVTINSVVRSDKRIVCVGNGGIIFSANVDINDKDLIIEPSAVNQEIYISRSDNVRMLHVKAVTRSIDPNIKPENIRKDVTVLGVKGTYGG